LAAVILHGQGPFITTLLQTSLGWGSWLSNTLASVKG
jgi:hypothetical protein